MQKEEFSKLADWLEAHKDAITDRSAKLDPAKVYQIVDDLKVLAKPATTYLTMSEDSYYESESDHQLTLDSGSATLGDLEDRIIINHVDGVVDEAQLHFTYNHEDPYKDGYTVKVDLNLLTYGLEVLGAAAILVPPKVLQDNLSKDAILSLIIAAHSVGKWQLQAQN